MTGFKRIPATIIVLLVIFSGLMLTSTVLGQDSTSQTVPMRRQAPELFYAHGMVGIGMDWYTSSNIQDILPEDFKLGSLGFPFEYGIRGGFKNIGQIEYRKFSTGSHAIRLQGFTGGSGVGGTGIGTVAETPMKFKSTEIAFKLNPFVWTWTGSNTNQPYKCLFLVYGTSDVSYRDDVNDGWKGNGTLYGIEYAMISKIFSADVGVVVQKIEYDEITLVDPDLPLSYDASHIMVYMHIAAGIGM